MIDFERKNRQIANSYYNVGLERAKMRDLTGAAESLKKSLRFDKYQMDARNLLGLIYYENGEVADALVQWVISMNLNPKDNPADRYLGEIQRKPGQLEVASQTVKKFNQALWYAQSGSDDLAVIQLASVVEDNPHFIKAHLLLALLYMSHGDFTKAGRSLYRILQIDKSNSKALFYMSLVKQNTGKDEIEKRKVTKAFSHRQMQDDDIIIPPTYKENTGVQTVFNIVIGLVIGIAAFYMLVLPAKTKTLNNLHNQEMISKSQQLNAKNQECNNLKGDYSRLETDYKAVQQKLSTIEDSNQGLLNQYQSLIGVLQAYRADDFLTAVKLFAESDFSLITEPSILAVVQDITADMTANGCKTLENLGTESWNAGKRNAAMDYYQYSLKLNPNNPQVMYYIGRLYQDTGDMDKANEMFGQVISGYPGTDAAAQAQAARGF